MFCATHRSGFSKGRAVSVRHVTRPEILNYRQTDEYGLLGQRSLEVQHGRNTEGYFTL